MRGSAIVLLITLAATSANALENCSEALAQMDATINSAREAGQSVESAEELRQSVEQMCGYLDQKTLDSMVEGLDLMLPMMSSLDDHVAEIESQARKAPAERKPQIAGSEPPFPESGRSLGGRLHERPDRMHQFGIWDMDRFNGKARVLYHTRPTREQFASPDWELVVYVVEVDREGNATQQLITRRQASDHAALALRRGTDELVLQRQQGEQDKDPRLERWSISRRLMLSSVPVPSPPWPDGGSWSRGAFLAPTADGNLFFAGVKSAPRGATEHSMGWFIASPSGDLLSRNMLTRSDRVAPGSAIVSNAGGGATLMTVSAGVSGAIESRVSTPIRREVDGRHIQASVAYEKRLFVVPDDGGSYWESPALERMLAWDGELAIPENLSIGDRMRQSQVQMEIMSATEAEFHAGRSIDSLDIGLKRVDMLRPMRGDRFAALARVSANRKLEPPVHGQYLLAVDEHAVTERLYLNPLAESLNLKFLTLAVSPSDQIYLLGVNQDSGAALIIRVNAAGEFDGYARSTAARSVTLEGLVADEDGVWLMGRGFPEGKIGDRLWTERLQF